MNKWTIMNASNLFDGKKATLKEIRTIWNNGAMMIVRKGKSLIAICGSGTIKDYRQNISEKVNYVIDTGLGYRKPPYGSLLEIVGMVNFDSNNFDFQGEFDENKKYGIYVFK